MTPSSSDYVAPGEPFKPSASLWNEFVDAAKLSAHTNI
jgi:hypothetical protein